VHLRPLHNTAAPFLLYAALQVLLLPTSYDATCLSLLSAMASGCPLVSASTPDTTDLLTSSSASLFPTHDLAACARLLADALQNPLLAQRRAQRARQQVLDSYNPTHQSQQLESILEYVSLHEV